MVWANKKECVILPVSAHNNTWYKAFIEMSDLTIIVLFTEIQTWTEYKCINLAQNWCEVVT